MKKITLLFTFLMCATLGFSQIAISTTTGAVPDDDPAGADFTGVAASAFNSITDVTLDLDISHTWNGDIIATLSSPEGTSVILVERPGLVDVTGCCGCNEDGMDITLSDAFGTPIEDCVGITGPDPAAVGDFGPNNPFSAFDGEDPNGIWTLNIVDSEGGDTGALDAATINITGETLGVDENEIGGFNMYPNPVSNSLTIEAPKAIETISIVNMLGQEIMRTAPNALESTLDMSDLQSGSYFVKATVDGVIATRRIIKE